MFRLLIRINGIKEIFETNQNETIRDLKWKIKESFGINPDFQRLEYLSSILDDDKKLKDYKIRSRSVICFYFYRKNDILQLLVRILNGTEVMLKTNKNGKIRGLKWKLKEKSNINMDDKELVFQGVILKDDKTVIEYNIYNNSIILLISRPKLVKIWIQPVRGDKFIIEIHTIETIRELKMKIQEKIKFDPNVDKPKLIFRESVLDDDETVEQCGICDEAVISLIILKPLFPISVKSDEGKTITMETHRNETIRDLKMKIHQRFELDPNDRRILFPEHFSEDDQSCLSGNDKTVSECGIVENCVINVDIRPENIFVRHLKIEYPDLQMKINERISIGLCDFSSCEDFISTRFFDHRFLHNEKTLDQCGIRDGDTISFVPEFRGGGGGISCRPKGGKSFLLLNLEKGKTRNRDLKMGIEAKMGIHPDDQILSHKGTLLNDEDSPPCRGDIDLDIGANLEKYLVVQLVYDELFLGIHLRKGTIRDLKEEIQEELGIHPDNQILSADGAILKDEQMLNENWIVALDIRRNEQSQVKQSQSKQSKPIQSHARKS